MSKPSALREKMTSWPRWWLWAAVGMTVSLMWTVPFIPWWAGLGSGLSAVLTLTVLAFYARKQEEAIPLEGEEVLDVTTDLYIKNPQVTVEVDREKAAVYGVSIDEDRAQILQCLRATSCNAPQDVSKMGRGEGVPNGDH